MGIGNELCKIKVKSKVACHELSTKKHTPGLCFPYFCSIISKK